jgi:type IV secretion system protein VirB8
MKDETFVKSAIDKMKAQNDYLKTSNRIIIFQFIVILALVGAVVSMLPLKENVPYFVQFSNNENNFVYVKKANQQIQSDVNLVNQALSTYIISRETVNQIDDDRRKDIVKAYSSNNVFTSYLNLFLANKKNYKDYIFRRKVKIITISNIKRDVAIVTIKLTDYSSSSLTDTVMHKKERLFRITLSFKFSNLKVAFKEANLNPMGLLIKNYNIEKVEN